jgi:hypothetical protein
VTTIADELASMPKMKALVDQSLQPDEKPEVLIVGAHQQLVLGTNRRVMVLKKGLMSGATFGGKGSSWDYRNVTGIQLDVRMKAIFNEPTDPSSNRHVLGEALLAPMAVSSTRLGRGWWVLILSGS